jgi:hypothetical protein
MNVRILVFWSRLRAVRRSILRTIFLAELVLAINLFPFSNSSARYRSESAPRQEEKSREDVKGRRQEKGGGTDGNMPHPSKT